MHLPAEPASVRRSRRWVGDVLHRLGAPPRTEQIAVLLTSELVTNAVQHAGTGIDVDATVRGAAVRIAVRDESNRRPTVRNPPLDASGGRGMRLIDLLAQDWGVDAQPGGGKEVWFELDLRRGAGSRTTHAVPA